jgi:hypothetical protein
VDSFDLLKVIGKGSFGKVNGTGRNNASTTTKKAQTLNYTNAPLSFPP